MRAADAVRRVLLTIFLTGCGVDPAAQCHKTAAATCKKLFECWVTAPEQAKLMLGTSAEECTTQSQARCDAATCEWNVTVGRQCATEFAALACNDVRAGVTPKSCLNTCK